LRDPWPQLELEIRANNSAILVHRPVIYCVTVVRFIALHTPYVDSIISRSKGKVSTVVRERSLRDMAGVPPEWRKDEIASAKIAQADGLVG
jgi:hypothetical protein